MTADTVKQRTTSAGKLMFPRTQPALQGARHSMPYGWWVLAWIIKTERPLGSSFPKGPHFSLRAKPSTPAFLCRSSPAEVTRLPSCQTPRETIEACEPYSERTLLSTPVTARIRLISWMRLARSRTAASRSRLVTSGSVASSCRQRRG